MQKLLSNVQSTGFCAQLDDVENEKSSKAVADLGSVSVARAIQPILHGVFVLKLKLQYGEHPYNLARIN